MRDFDIDRQKSDQLRRKAWRRRCLVRLSELLPNAPRERLERIAVEMSISDFWLALGPETAAFRLQAQQEFPIAVGLGASGELARLPRPVDRRSGGERRREEAGPAPGRAERRTSVEPRLPEVSELDLTHSDWVALVEMTGDT